MEDQKLFIRKKENGIMNGRVILYGEKYIWDAWDDKGLVSSGSCDSLDEAINSVEKRVGN